MSAAAGPYGFIAVRHPSGQNRAEPYQIQNNAGAGYATNLFKGDMVILNTAGYVTIGTGAADLLGVFVGCEYTDSTGKPVVSNFWPASTALQVGSVATAWVITDPATVYSVQATGSLAATSVGDQADLSTSTAGSTATGISGQALSTLVGAGVQGQFRIIDIDRDPSNAWGDAFTKVLVQLARSQYVSNKVAI